MYDVPHSPQQDLHQPPLEASVLKIRLAVKVPTTDPECYIRIKWWYNIVE